MSNLAGQIKAVLSGAAISIVLYFSGLLTFITPLPMIYLYVVRGRAAGLISAVLSVAAVAAAYAFFMSHAQALEGAASYFIMPGQGFYGYLPTALIKAGGAGYFLFFAVIGVALGEGARKRWDIFKWGGTALIAALAVLIAIALLSFNFGLDQVAGGLRAYLVTLFGEVARAGEQAGEVSAQMTFLAERAGEVASLFVRMLPSIAFVITVLTVAINIVICRRIVRGQHAFSHVHNVARFRVPDALIWGVIACGVGFFLDTYAVSNWWLKTIAMNGLISFGVLYFLQGMAVIVYFVQGIKAPLIRTLAYVAMIIFLQTVSMGLLVVGVADVWANFRLRRWRSIHHRHDQQ